MKTQLIEDFTLDILALDSIYGVLRWEDRIDIRLYLQGKADIEIFNNKVWKVLDWIFKNNWERPSVAFVKDRPVEDGFLIKCDGRMMTIKEYAAMKPIDNCLLI